MLVFIDSMPDEHPDEWYNTDKELAEMVIGWFASDLKIDLKE